jgi:hypothetical protein
LIASGAYAPQQPKTLVSGKVDNKCIVQQLSAIGKQQIASKIAFSVHRAFGN